MRGAVEQRPGMAMPQNETWQKSHLEVCGAWRASRLSLCRVGGERIRIRIMTKKEGKGGGNKVKTLAICSPTRSPHSTRKANKLESTKYRNQDSPITTIRMSGWGTVIRDPGIIGICIGIDKGLGTPPAELVSG